MAYPGKTGFGINWDADGERLFETGVERVALYVKGGTGDLSGASATGYGSAIAWNGVTGVSEAPEGGEANAVYADDMKYLNRMSTEEFAGSITAYTFPEEFMVCDGTASTTADGVYLGQQKRKEFGLCYTTRIGNDEDDDSHGYKIHVVYGCLASPSSKDRSTTNDSPEEVEFSWDFTTTPTTDVPSGFKATSYLCIDSTSADATKLAALEKSLFGEAAASSGGTATTGHLLSPSAIITAMTSSI